VADEFTDDAGRVLVTVLFIDMVDSSRHADRLGDRRWRALLADYHTAVRERLQRFQGNEIDSAGDGFLVSFDGAGRAVRCAAAIREAARGLGLALRAGLHAGECEQSGGKLVGIAVHIGARLATLAAPGEILVSSTVKDLVSGSGITFEDRGGHMLKGIADEWRVYAARI
jgi:class 3 adenylate cyclase